MSANARKSYQQRGCVTAVATPRWGVVFARQNTLATEYERPKYLINAPSMMNSQISSQVVSSRTTTSNAYKKWRLRFDAGRGLRVTYVWVTF